MDAPRAVHAPRTVPACSPSVIGAAYTHHHHRAAPPPSGTPGLVPLSSGVSGLALAMSPYVPFPVYLPSMQTDLAVQNDFHPYTIRDDQGHLYYGYRIDWSDGQPGLYYGIEGMNWTDPPLFANPTETATINGRKYMFIDDGSAFHDIGWRQGGELYWISNTLLETLTNQQMLALAESASAVTASHT